MNYCRGKKLLSIAAIVGRRTAAAFSLTPSSSSPLSTALFQTSNMASSTASKSQQSYPRPLHPGGFSLPPLVEDRLSIATTSAAADNDKEADGKEDCLLQTDVLLVRPPDMADLWEWYAYTKRQTDSDPSWGRVWPTALSLSRLVLRSLNDGGEENTISEGGDEKNVTDKEEELMNSALDALRTSSHVVEVGCGLGVAGLSYASFVASSTAAQNNANVRTVTFLDREPYALHCAMASAQTNGLTVGPIIPPETTEESNGDAGEEALNEDNAVPAITVRAAMDDWTLPTSDENDSNDNNSPIKNICYRDLHLDNQDTILLASDIIYEPSSMQCLATKLRSLLHPTNGGYALIADPVKERTPGCRDAFVESIRELGGEVGILSMPGLEERNKGMKLLEGDVDIDGNLAETVLIVVHF